MRIIVNGSGLFVLLAILILTHSGIVNKNLRDSEVSSGLNSACEYAMDEMRDMYKAMVYDETKDSEYTAALIEKFCDSLESVIGSDGDISVSVREADIKDGTFSFIVREEYSYSFLGRKGVAVCESVGDFR